MNVPQPNACIHVVLVVIACSNSYFGIEVLIHKELKKGKEKLPFSVPMCQGCQAHFSYIPLFLQNL